MDSLFLTVQRAHTVLQIFHYFAGLEQTNKKISVKHHETILLKSSSVWNLWHFCQQESLLLLFILLQTHSVSEARTSLINIKLTFSES